MCRAHDPVCTQLTGPVVLATEIPKLDWRTEGEMFYLGC